MNTITASKTIIGDQRDWWLAASLQLSAAGLAGNQTSIQFNSEKFEQEEART